MALEHDVQFVALGKLGGDADAISLQIFDRAPNQPRHLARMRRDNQVAAFAADQQRRFVGKRVERIGIEHQGAIVFVDQLTDERRHALASSQPGSGDDDVGLDAQHRRHRREVHRAVRRLIEALGHVLDTVRGNGRLARPR